MMKARVTGKGQVTVPAPLRRLMDIETGDDIVFTVDGDVAHMRVVKRKRVADLYRALPATRPFPGRDAIRDAVGLASASEPRGDRA